MIKIESNKKVKAMGVSLLDKIINADKFVDLYNDIGEEDEQSAKLLMDIADYFEERFTLKNNEEAALNRLSNLIAAGNRNSANTRNQVFKIADSLKMKLPSSMF